MKDQTIHNLRIPSSIALALAIGLATPSYAAEPQAKQGMMMMMNHTTEWMTGWMGGGMWIWTVIGILVVILLVVLISKLSRK